MFDTCMARLRCAFTALLLLCGMVCGACNETTAPGTAPPTTIYASGQILLHILSDTAATLDFARMGDSCLIDSWQAVRHSPFDVAIRWDSIFAPLGISGLGVFDSDPLNVIFMHCKRDSLDAVLAARDVSLPCDNFRTALPNEAGHFYVLRTGRGRYAILANTGYYYGGIDRQHFYWALVR